MGSFIIASKINRLPHVQHKKNSPCLVSSLQVGRLGAHFAYATTASLCVTRVCVKRG